MTTINPALSILRAYRLLDPELSDLLPRQGSDDQEWLANALLISGHVDEPGNAAELAAALLREDACAIGGLLTLAASLVEIRDGVPVSRSDDIWLEVGRAIDTDLLVAAFLACRRPPPEDGRLLATLSWPSVLWSSAFGIELVVRQELADCHVHLGGALPGSFYWLAAMTGYAHLDRILAWPERFAARWYCKVVDTKKLRDKLINRQWPIAVVAQLASEPAGDGPEEAFVDPLLAWLVPRPVQRARLNPVLGERLLLWTCLREVVQGTAPYPGFINDLLRYLRCRCSFLRQLAHQPGARGLYRFQRTFRRSNLVFANLPRTGERSERDDRRRRRAQRAILKLERFRTRHSLRYLLSDPTDAPWARDLAPAPATGETAPAPSVWRPPRQIELRVSPFAAPPMSRVLFAYLSGLRDFLRWDPEAPPVRVGLAFHLYKTPQLRLVARQQLEWIFATLRFLPGLRPFVVGLDAAGPETQTPPRDLAATFTWAQQEVAGAQPLPGEPPLRLRRTFHAGEDFRDLLTGLRYIDDAVHLLCLEPGERIGHGLAAAFLPQQWYGDRQYVYPLRGDHAIDLLWAWYLGEQSIPGLGPDTGLISDVMVMLHGHLDLQPSKDLKKAVRQYADRSDEDGTALQHDTEQLLLAQAGLTGEELQEPMPVLIDAPYRRVVARVRQRVLVRLELAEVVIEVCPTSNLLISGLRSYGQLPYPNLNRFGLGDDGSDQPQIPLSINSDDPGVFRTTVANEYRLLGRAMINGSTRRRQVVAWLEEARQVGLASTFIPPWSPPTREELLRAIDELDRNRQPPGR